MTYACEPEDKRQWFPSRGWQPLSRTCWLLMSTRCHFIRSPEIQCRAVIRSHLCLQKVNPRSPPALLWAPCVAHHSREAVSLLSTCSWILRFECYRKQTGILRSECGSLSYFRIFCPFTISVTTRSRWVAKSRSGKNNNADNHYFYNVNQFTQMKTSKFCKRLPKADGPEIDLIAGIK